MSLLRRWENKYYKNDAHLTANLKLREFIDLDEDSKGFSDLSEEQMLLVEIEVTKHSLAKWSGAVYLEEFNEVQGRNFDSSLVVNKKAIREVNSVGGQVDWFFFDGSSCSLCSLVLDINNSGSCEGCPITMATGFSCDGGSEGLEYIAPYNKFSDSGDPLPMYETLLKTYAYLHSELSALKIPTLEADIIPVVNL